MAGESSAQKKEEGFRESSSPIGNIKVTKPPHLSEYIPQISDESSNFTNPLENNPFYHPLSIDGFYISANDVVLRQVLYDVVGESQPAEAYVRAGPRKQICFDPKTTSSYVKAAIVTCGGLCPGVNTVIRELVVGLWELYGAREIYGIRSGYRGFYSDAPLPLNPKMVHDWHKRGGTLLGTSRGGFDLIKIVHSIQRLSFNQVYIIGGDGTMRGAVKIYEEIRRRGLKISVAGIPKTVDNDVGLIDQSFGFQTAVEMALQAVSAAHVEAESAVNGIGLVKLMGRSTGHIALHATLSSRDVDCCLIPENDFFLRGTGGLFEFLEQRIRENGHAVLVVAEGAGQELIPRSREDEERQQRDESGNPAFLDVGVWLKSELSKWWKSERQGELVTVKYIDPTYMVRAVPANATDNLYCTLLAHSAIHGAMAGYTGFVAARVNGNYVYIPVEDVAKAKHVVDTKYHKWAWVRSVTNQPDFVKG